MPSTQPSLRIPDCLEEHGSPMPCVCGLDDDFPGQAGVLDAPNAAGAPAPHQAY